MGVHMQANSIHAEQNPTRVYQPLRANKTTRASDFRQRPDDLFDTSDIASAGILRSLASIRRNVGSGRFPAPMRLPTGRLAWRGRTIAEWLDRLEAQAAAQ